MRGFYRNTTQTPAGSTLEANVSPYGWTGAEAQSISQIIDYVNQCKGYSDDASSSASLAKNSELLCLDYVDKAKGWAERAQDAYLDTRLEADRAEQSADHSTDIYNAFLSIESSKRIVETIQLGGTETVITFSQIVADIAFITISGPRVDGSSLVKGIDYSVDTPSQITLKRTYPEGTVLIGYHDVQKDQAPLGDISTSLNTWNRQVVVPLVGTRYQTYIESGRALTPRISFEGYHYLPMYDASEGVTFQGAPSVGSDGTITIRTDKGDKQFSKVLGEAVDNQTMTESIKVESDKNDTRFNQLYSSEGASRIKTSSNLSVQEELTSLKERVVTGVKVFSTFAELDAYTPTVSEQQGSFKVTYDPNKSRNGYYTWVSDTTYRKDASLVSTTISPDNTSDAVSGSAVYNHVSRLNWFQTGRLKASYGAVDINIDDKTVSLSHTSWVTGNCGFFSIEPFEAKPWFYDTDTPNYTELWYLVFGIKTQQIDMIHYRAANKLNKDDYITVGYFSSKGSYLKSLIVMGDYKVNGVNYVNGSEQPSSTKAKNKNWTSVLPFSGVIKIDTEQNTVETTGTCFVVYNDSSYSVVTHTPVKWETDVPGGSFKLSELFYVIYDITTKSVRVVHYRRYESTYAQDPDFVMLGSLNKTNQWGVTCTINGTYEIDGVLYSTEPHKVTPKDTTFFEEADLSKNIFNPAAAKMNGYYNNTDGYTWIPSSSYFVTDFIPVSDGETILLNGDTGTTNTWIYLYDENKRFIRYTSSMPKKYVVPTGEGVRYFIKIGDLKELSTYMVVRGNKFPGQYSEFGGYEYKMKRAYLPSTSSSNQSQSVYGVSDLGPVSYQDFNTDYSHIMFYGQSLSMGWEADAAITTTPYSNTFMIGDRVWYGRDSDNLDATDFTPLKATMSKGNTCGESPAISTTNSFKRLFDRLHRRGTQVKFLTSNCGEGGRSIERLSKECTNGINHYNESFLRCIKKAKEIVDTKDKSISCSAIVWMQGEYNYTNLTNNGLTPGSDATNDKDQYKSYLKVLKDNMQSDIMTTYVQTEKPLFFVYQVGGSYINREDMSINMALVEFAEENEDVILLNPVYPFPDYTNGHLTTNGYRWYGEMIAKSFYKTLIQGQGDNTVKVKGISYADSVITLDCVVPTPPLCIDYGLSIPVQNLGFKVMDGGKEVPITDVQVGGSSIFVSTQTSLSPSATISYAGQGRSGTGSIRDSDSWNSQYPYVDETSMRKPQHTPVDDSGNNFYGKKYPMYNWLGNFYHTIR